MDNEFEKIAKDSLPDLSKLGKQLDISQIPAVFVGDLRTIGWELEVTWNEAQPEMSTIDLYLYFPIMPFFKFVIRFSVPDTNETGFRKFIADLELALKFFEDKINGKTEENPS